MFSHSSPNDTIESISKFETHKWFMLEMGGSDDGMSSPLCTYIGKNRFIYIFMSTAQVDTITDLIKDRGYRVIEFTAPLGAHEMIGMWLFLMDEAEAEGVVVIHDNGMHRMIDKSKLISWFGVVEGHAMISANLRKASAEKVKGKWLSHANIL